MSSVPDVGVCAQERAVTIFVRLSPGDSYWIAEARGVRQIDVASAEEAARKVGSYLFDVYPRDVELLPLGEAGDGRGFMASRRQEPSALPKLGRFFLLWFMFAAVAWGGVLLAFYGALKWWGLR